MNFVKLVEDKAITNKESIITNDNYDNDINGSYDSKDVKNMYSLIPLLNLELKHVFCNNIMLTEGIY